MAKALFGSIVGDSRGKLGGTVFAKNAYGVYIKKKTSPCNTNTQLQTNIKNRFTANLKNWASLLTQDYRDHWDTLATTFTINDVFGNPQHLSGIALFVSVNQNLHTLSLPALADAPADHAATDIGPITLSEITGPPKHLRIAWTNGLTSTDQLVVYASGPQSQGKKKYQAKNLRILQVFPTLTTSPADFTAAWQARYGLINPGTAIAVAACAIRGTNGAKGATHQALLYLT